MSIDAIALFAARDFDAALLFLGVGELDTARLPQQPEQPHCVMRSQDPKALALLLLLCVFLHKGSWLTFTTSVVGDGGSDFGFDKDLDDPGILPLSADTGLL